MAPRRTTPRLTTNELTLAVSLNASRVTDAIEIVSVCRSQATNAASFNEISKKETVK